jgi:hypothetical protein
VLISGNVSAAKRQDIVTAFNRHNVGQVRAIVPASGSVGFGHAEKRGTGGHCLYVDRTVHGMLAFPLSCMITGVPHAGHASVR